MATKIYTKTGDCGETGLFGGARVPKDHTRVEAYGTVDELNAALGVVRLQCAQLPTIDEVLVAVQSLLFELGGELALASSSAPTHSVISNADIVELEHHIDQFESELAPLKSFILPGGTPAAAHLHLARTVCRRAERCVVTLQREDTSVSPLCLIFLNRLSDLLFVLARFANAATGVVDVPWRTRTRTRSGSEA